MNQNHHLLDIDEISVTNDFDENIIDKMSAEDILDVVQQLPPAYKMVFNLYVQEGYKHHEIAERLEITTGTSKSNLAKARKKLQMALLSLNVKVN